MILAHLTLTWALAGSAPVPAVDPTWLASTAATAEPQRGGGRAQGKSNRRKGGKRILGGSKQSAKRGVGPGQGRQERQAAPPQELKLPPEELEDQIRGWFVVADYDLNDWISYREAKKSLSFDQLRFRVYDTDRDGRIRFSEFKAFHDDSVYRGGRFREPRPESGRPRPPQRSPELLRNAYDLDLDGSIGLLELARILIDYGRDDVTAETALAGLDSDRNGRLGVFELSGLTGILHPVVLPLPTDDTADQSERGGKPKTITELFGRVSLRDGGIGAAPTPPLIVGPVPHFRRLDINDDGSVSVSDLQGLLRPLQLPIRVHSVISTLDRDGDGVLSAEEFEGAVADFEE